MVRFSKDTRWCSELNRGKLPAVKQTMAWRVTSTLSRSAKRPDHISETATSCRASGRSYIESSLAEGRAFFPCTAKFQDLDSLRSAYLGYRFQFSRMFPFSSIHFQCLYRQDARSRQIIYCSCLALCSTACQPGRTFFARNPLRRTLNARPSSAFSNSATSATLPPDST